MRAPPRSLFLHPALLLIAALAIGCQKSKTEGSGGSAATGSSGASGGTGPAAGSAPAAAAPVKDLDSKDILARPAGTGAVQVKHVLIAWKELAPAYGGHIDPRAAKRSNDEAAALAQDVATKLRANPDSIDALIKEHSEDPGSLTGEPYTVTADAGFVPEFKNLALRLKEKEVGIVKTTYGYHVMERVPPPAPDPLESADILARPAEAGPVEVQHVLIGWKDVPAAAQRGVDPRAAQRTKADADKVAKEILDKARGGADFTQLMKESSEDPGSKDTGKPYSVAADTPFVEPFKNMALRLKVGEVGIVKSPFGWHVMKRVPPPPPDPIESADILKREPPAAKAKVKHILLGWSELHADDPRGTKRTRAELEALVKKTVAALQKGGKIEPMMAELSEDPGSAKSGTSYDVTADASLVAPFKNLSLRLKVGEVGVVKTQFGVHIIKRIE
jgi:parvulin-like peptidyl-prolyl isomerase